MSIFLSFLSEEETKKVTEALMDPDWVIAKQDELNQFKADCVEAGIQTECQSTNWYKDNHKITGCEWHCYEEQSQTGC